MNANSEQWEELKTIKNLVSNKYEKREKKHDKMESK